MELTPQLLTDEIDFRIAVRGYDRHEVDDFLERVAVAVGQLQSQLTKAVARAKSAEARLAEIDSGGETAATGAEPSADAARASSQAKHESTTVGAASERVDDAGSAPVKAPPSAPVPVVGGDDALNEELRRTLVLAQRTADTAIREAHDEAREIVEQANDEARRTREAAEAAHAKAREEAHGRLVAEIRELEATRESMRSDTVVLERHLGTERARVRETIQVLRRLVDDPESFRTAQTPELSGATTPAALGPAPASGEPDPPSGEAPIDDGPADAAASDAAPHGDPSITDAPAADAESDMQTGSAGDAADGAGSDADTSADATDAGGGDQSAPGDDAGEAPASGAVSSASTASAATAAATTPDSSSDRRGVSAEARSADGDPEDSEAAPEGSESDSARLGQLFGSAESTRDWRSSGPDRGDQGPHTQPVAAARFEEESDEAFLAELRRAMSDDEPLGPSETDG